MILPREIYVQVQHTVMLISWKVCPGENPLDLIIITLFCFVMYKEQTKNNKRNLNSCF